MGERARLPATVRRPPPQPRSLPGCVRRARRTDRRPPHGRAPPERARGVPPRAARRAHRLGDRPSSRTLAAAPRSGRPRDRADRVEPRGVRRQRGDRSRRGRAPRRLRPGAGRRRGAARAPAGARRLLHDCPVGPAQGAGRGRARVPPRVHGRRSRRPRREDDAVHAVPAAGSVGADIGPQRHDHARARVAPARAPAPAARPRRDRRVDTVAARRPPHSGRLLRLALTRRGVGPGRLRRGRVTATPS